MFDSPQVRFSGTQAGPLVRAPETSQPASPSTAEPVQPEKGSSAGAPLTKPSGTLEASTGNTAPQPKYLTEAEAREIARREYQSLRDKEAARAQKAQAFTKAQLAALEAAGVSLTPEQKAQLGQTISTNFQLELDPSPEHPTGSPAGTGKIGTEHFVQEPGTPLQEAEKIMLELVNELGYDIGSNDPELATIDASSPRKYIKTYEAALEAKRTRLASEGIRTPTNPQANLPALVGKTSIGNSIAGINDPDTLWQQAMKKGT